MNIVMVNLYANMQFKKRTVRYTCLTINSELQIKTLSKLIELNKTKNFQFVTL